MRSHREICKFYDMIYDFFTATFSHLTIFAIRSHDFLRSFVNGLYYET